MLGLSLLFCVDWDGEASPEVPERRAAHGLSRLQRIAGRSRKLPIWPMVPSKGAEGRLDLGAFTWVTALVYSS